MVRIALAGDTMLGRCVGERLATAPFPSLVDPGVRALTAGADACLLNLECCVSERGSPWPAPGKPFFFRAPPRAASLLAWLGVDCVTLANNHALDYGPAALLDTRRHLAQTGIGVVGAGADVDQARAWHLLTVDGIRIGVLGVTDHPPDFAAAVDRPGVAFADLRRQMPSWLRQSVADMAAQVDIAIVTPHWGRNMTTAPEPHVRAGAQALRQAGADLVAGHSAHVFHGVAGPVLFDLGDFIDDYRRDPELRNDLGLLFIVTVDKHGPIGLEAIPIGLDFGHTRLARPDEADWIRHRFTTASNKLGTPVTATGDGRLAIALR